MATAPQSVQGRERTFRPPEISYALAAGWLIATLLLHSTGKQGSEVASLLCLFTMVMMISQIIIGMKDGIVVGLFRWREKSFKNEAEEQGKARFATAEDIAEADDLSDHQGIFLGSLPVENGPDQDTFFHGSGSISIIAPAGLGKSMALIATTILAAAVLATRRKDIPTQNYLLHDPSGELYSILGPALRQAGYETPTIAPFYTETSSLTGQHLRDCGLDIFSSLDPEMDPSRLRSQLLMIMNWVMPGKADMSPKDQYFYKYGRMIGSFLALYLMKNGQTPTLPTIRELLMLGLSHIEDLLHEAEKDDAFIGQELCRAILGMLRTAPQQMAGGYGIAESAFDFFCRDSAMGVHTSGSTFDPRSLKNPNKKVAAFVIYPLDKLEAYREPISMSLTYIFDSIAADNQTGRVNALIDECGSLVMPKLAASLNFYRKANLRCIMCWQDLSGQTLQNYGKAGMTQIMAASQYKIAMGIQEPETLKMFSDLCGTKSVSEQSLNDQAGMNSAMPDLSPTLNNRSVPLMRPEDILALGKDEMLVIGNVYPMILKKIPYFRRPAWNAIAGPSPYHQG